MTAISGEISASKFRSILQADPDRFAPLSISAVTEQRAGASDLCIDIGYRDRQLSFAVIIKASSTPKVARTAIEKLVERQAKGAYPMLAVPYLSPDLVTLLEEADISGIDLNGNYLIRTPELVAIRLDRPNAYREQKTIKNIYAANSSIVGRYLLVAPGPYRQVNEIAAGIAELGGGITLGTISKALNGLADDLVIDRGRGEIRLVQPHKLLDKLRENYRAPKVTDLLRLKLPGDRAAIASLLDKTLGADDWVWSGESSAERYATTTPAQQPSLFTRAGFDRIAALRGYEESRFYNCEIRVSDDAFVYFARSDRWASVIECYLALSKLDKREREIAEEIEPLILERANGNP